MIKKKTLRNRMTWSPLLKGTYRKHMGLHSGSVVKNLPAMRETQETQEMRVQFLGWEDPLEEEMAMHSSILAWRTPRTASLGGYSP